MNRLTLRGATHSTRGAAAVGRWGVLEAMLAAGAEYRAGTRWFDAQGSHLLTVPVPEIEGCIGFPFLNHEKIGRVLLDRACQSGAVSVAGISQWEVERVDQGWRIDWRPDSASVVRCTLLVALTAPHPHYVSALIFP